MGGSTVFARWRQSAPPSASTPYWFCPLQTRFEHINHGHIWAKAVGHLGLLKKLELLTIKLKGCKCIIESDFIAIRITTAELWDFNSFCKMGAIR